MPASTLTTVALGPFTGLVDTRNPSGVTPGALRTMRNLILSGDQKLSVMAGSAVALTLKDDQGTPATVTSVLHVGPFMDGAVAVSYSSVTSKVYVYRLTASMDGWYDATGALQSTASPQPCAVLWTSVVVAPDVSVAEGLGTLYVASTSAIDVAGCYFTTKQVTFSSAGVPTVANLKANGTGLSVGADDAYFTLICAFHQHLWGWGYGAGAVAGYTSYRPELGKFSQPSFDPFQTADSIVFGDRVRALRERPLIAKVAGNAMFVGASKTLFRVTGYGRDSWVIETLDQQFGVVGPKAGCAVGPAFYYGTSRGPARCMDGGAPEYLWDAVTAAWSAVANEAKVVVAHDPATDRVLFTYDSGSGVRTLCAFDVRRGSFVSGDGDIGLAINCGGIVEPIAASTATPPAPPAVPTIVSTTLVGDTSARLTWSVGDALAQHEVSYRVQGAPVYSTLPLATAAQTTTDLTGLLSGTHYEWRIRAYNNGVYSAYVGPVAASQFTTTGTPGTTPPPAPTGLSAS